MLVPIGGPLSSSVAVTLPCLLVAVILLSGFRGPFRP